MDMFQLYEERIKKVIGQLQDGDVLPKNLDLSKLTVEPPRDRDHGDIATNAALILSKPAKMAPRDLAALLTPKFQDLDHVEQCDIAGPGFINLRLAKGFWPQIVSSILKNPDRFGQSDLGAEQKVNIEYVSANPTGPMHVGHCRGAVFGDALANLLAFNQFDVTREYYMNDAGSQVDVLARSAFLRYREARGEEIGAIPEGLYPGDYLVGVGKAMAEKFGDTLLTQSEEQWLPVVKDMAIEHMMDMIREDLSALNIRHDVFFSERTLHEDSGETGITNTIDWLRDHGLIYQGRLDPPKGKMPDDWEDRDQTLFKAESFGDDVDRALIKSDGTYTYFAADIAYHKNKFDRGFLNQIDVLGADHSGYVKRLTAAVRAISEERAVLTVKICQLVHLLRNGEPVKMSKRAGTFVTLREVVDEVGVDAVRFMMLYRKNDAPLDFDFQKVTEHNRDNPVFYVQYAHARACSVLRNAKESFDFTTENQLTSSEDYLKRLVDEAEIQIIKQLAVFPRVVRASCQSQEPHRIAFYIYELSSDFHALWNWGKVKPHLRFIDESDTELTIARMQLVQSVASVLKIGLGLLGVSSPEKMA